MTIWVLQQETSQDEHLQQPQEHIIKGWPENKDQIPQDMRIYFTIWDDMAVNDRVVLKGRHSVIPETLQRQALEQPHNDHMGIEKLNLACVSIFGQVWIIILKSA